MQRRVIIGSLIAVVAVAVGAALLLSRALPAGSHASGPRDDPAAFVSRIVRLVVADDYAAAWLSLNPAHKQVAPKQEYVACERSSPVRSRVKSIQVLRVVDRDLRIPGASRSVKVKAVTLHIEVRNSVLETTETFKHTFNAVPDGSDWTWVLTPGRYALYRDNACGTTT